MLLLRAVYGQFFLIVCICWHLQKKVALNEEEKKSNFFLKYFLGGKQFVYGYKFGIIWYMYCGVNSKFFDFFSSSF